MWPVQVATELASDKSRRVRLFINTHAAKEEEEAETGERKEEAGCCLLEADLAAAAVVLLLTMMRNINHNASSKASTQIPRSPSHAPTPSNSRSDSQICTASHISVVIFAVLPLLRMRAKETHPPVGVCVCMCECGSFCLPPARPRAL